MLSLLRNTKGFPVLSTESGKDFFFFNREAIRFDLLCTSVSLALSPPGEDLVFGCSGRPYPSSGKDADTPHATWILGWCTLCEGKFTV